MASGGSTVAALGLVLVGAAACTAAAAPGERSAPANDALTVGDVTNLIEPSGAEDSAASSPDNCKFNGRGERLFKCETFGGNGRTCATCHSDQTGTFSPAEAQALFATAPNAPLFRSIDSDQGLGLTYTRLLGDAVIRAGVTLAPNVTIAELPTARTIVLNRGVPTTLNTPALDTVLMSDGRAPNLQAQAHDAILGHAQATVTPTTSQLDAIAKYETTLFSSPQLEAFARNGTVPTLPPGNTASEQRGRLLFVPGPNGKCAGCHGGPMLNTTTDLNINPAVPPGSRFETALVSELNEAKNPVYTFIFTNPDGSVTPVTSPDPGRGLVTGRVADSFPLATFKIPTLWGVSRTAPYFHDDSAKTLEDVGVHYQRFFLAGSVFFNRPDVVMSDQERDDMVAYLRLL